MPTLYALMAGFNRLDRRGLTSGRPVVSSWFWHSTLAFFAPLWSARSDGSTAPHRCCAPDAGSFRGALPLAGCWPAGRFAGLWRMSLSRWRRSCNQCAVFSEHFTLWQVLFVTQMRNYRYGSFTGNSLAGLPV